ncbi:hypothetical protein BGW42_003570 [Actinomortierella wolfii]|nr:hypothetical protein BGW42_003570 [Actinomortierella wolfii]
MSSPDSTLSAVATSPASTTAAEEESILSFLTTDFLESQTTTLPFEGPHFFDNLAVSPNTDNILKYEYDDLLHPPSPPTSNGTFSDTSGSPLQPMVDSCDEGSTSDVPMETTNALEYWQYVYADLARQQQDQQKHDTSAQPGGWPLLSLAASNDPSLATIPPKLPLLRPALTPNGVPATILPTIPGVAATMLPTPPGPLPPSPNASVKSEKEKPEKKAPKRARKNNNSSSASAASGTSAVSGSATSSSTSSPRPTPKLAPSPPNLAPAPVPLKPLLPLAPAPPSPPMTAQDAASGGNKALASISPAIQPAPGLRRPSIVPAITPNPSRSSTVIVKSTMTTEEKPQSEAALTAQAKRQERLIKNRAAALLSRKRKREHISLLESHTDQLKTENKELKERVSELEENVKTLTSERDAARKEVDRLTRQVTILTSHRLDTKMEIDLERNSRLSDSERVLNSKATGVVFMIILFSFALFTLPSRKLDTLMVGGRMERPRIGSSIVGRALDTYTKNPTIAGQVQEIKTTTQSENINGNNNNQDINQTDLVVFSDNRVLQNWLGHHRLPTDSGDVAVSGSVPKVVVSPPSSRSSSAVPEEADGSEIKSVGFVAQKYPAQPWDLPENEMMEEPDRDALLYCANLLYSFRASNLVRPAGTTRTKDGRLRRPRFSIYSPLEGVHGQQEEPSSASSTSNNNLPPWMPKSTHDETNSKQQFLRLDVEVTSSRVVSGKNLMEQEQIIRFPIGTFENRTSTASSRVSVASSAESEASAPTLPSKSSSLNDSELPPSWQPRTRLRPLHNTRTARVNGHGGVAKPGSEGSGYRRRLYQRSNVVAQMAARAMEEKDLVDDPLPTIKEEPVEIFIKEEPMD